MLNSRLFSQSLQLRQASVNKSVLKNGDKGNGVSLYQAALIRCGHPMPLTTRNQSTYPDGIFGKETEDKTRQFQRENGLYADGVVGKNTLGFWTRSLPRQSPDCMTTIRFSDIREPTSRKSREVSSEAPEGPSQSRVHP